jgi:hypothetical protein
MRNENVIDVVLRSFDDSHETRIFIAFIRVAQTLVTATVKQNLNVANSEQVAGCRVFLLVQDVGELDVEGRLLEVGESLAF